VVVEKLDVAANLTALLDEIRSNEGIAMQAELKPSINAFRWGTPPPGDSSKKKS
jgi:hypothetical protein